MAEKITHKATFEARLNQATVFDENETHFEIIAIEAGMSKTNYLWPADVLQAAVPLFDQKPVQALLNESWQHGSDIESSLTIGGLTDVRFEDGKVIAKLVIVDQEHNAVSKLRESIKQGIPNLFGFSIFANVLAEQKQGDDGIYLHINQIIEVIAVDMVIRPAAGGHPVKLTQSREKDSTMNEDDKKPVAAVQQQVEQNAKQPQTITVSQADFANLQKELQDLKDAQSLAEQKAVDLQSIAQSELPQAAKDRLVAQAGGEGFVVAEAIKAEGEYIGSVTQAASPVNGLGQVQVTVSQDEKFDKALDKIIDGTVGIGEMRSIRQAYQQATGDNDVTGRIVTQSTTIDFPSSLGNALHRRMLKTHGDLTQFDNYKLIAGTPIPLNDFKERKGITLGGFGDLPVVAEKKEYTDLGKTPERTEKYSPAKRGGTAQVTLEMIKNDDVGLIMKIPQKLAIAAKRTLNSFVMDKLVNNPQMSDNNNLFSAAHKNLLTVPLTAQNVMTARKMMIGQKEEGSNQVLGLVPKYIFVSPDLQETAFNLFQRSTNNDKSFLQANALEVVMVPEWTDGNDWIIAANPMLHDHCELGFVDGRTEPEMFIQDQPNVGSVFTNDVITYKLRHIYGGAMVDWRGLVKSKVA